MLSALPLRLLNHPKGGALAVLGHVDRAWTRSFGSGRGRYGHLHIEALLRNLLQGFPVGSAMDWMHERFAEISTEVTEVLDEHQEPLVAGTAPVPPSRGRLAKLWRANNDARNFVVLGDPAVRAPVAMQQKEKLLPGEPSAVLQNTETIRVTTSPTDVLRQERAAARGPSVVIDASAVAELLLETPEADRIRQRINAIGSTLHAPHLLDVEIAQILHRYVSTGELNPKQRDDALRRLGALEIVRHTSTASVLRLLELQEQMDVYDATYLALAESLSVPLLTRQERLASFTATCKARIEVV
jgi:predicted nucleic acid-binding protein